MEPLFEKLKQKAIAHKQRIVLPESTEPRTLRAADRVLTEEVAQVILIGNKDDILSQANTLGLPNIGKASIIDPNDNESVEKYAQLFFELRKNKGVTMEDALKKVKDPLYLGCLLIKAGDADGQVAGALNATGDVLRPAFQILKTAPGVKTVSGAFIMILPVGSPYGDNGVMVFADCAALPDATAEDLAQIAVSADHTARTLAGIENPKIAMLSFSTKGSAKHEKVDKVVKATQLALEINRNLNIDGELQADAAIVPSVGMSKAPGSKIAGNANVLVFPSLEAGNIGYKLVQRLCGATAVGPVLQGLAAPVNDLSRGCNEEEVYKTILLTCNQAINR